MYTRETCTAYDAASGVFIRNASQLSGIDQDAAADDGLSFANQSFIESCSCILYTAELKHGGTLLLVPEESTHEDSRLLSLVSITKPCPARDRETLWCRQCRRG